MKGVVCHVAYFNRSLIDRLQQGNWFEDPSYSAIDCAASGPVTVGKISTRHRRRGNLQAAAQPDLEEPACHARLRPGQQFAGLSCPCPRTAVGLGQDVAFRRAAGGSQRDLDEWRSGYQISRTGTPLVEHLVDGYIAVDGQSLDIASPAIMASPSELDIAIASSLIASPEAIASVSIELVAMASPDIIASLDIASECIESIGGQSVIASAAKAGAAHKVKIAAAARSVVSVHGALLKPDLERGDPRRRTNHCPITSAQLTSRAVAAS